jgi:manganese/iron transport system ATP-binding protein
MPKHTHHHEHSSHAVETRELNVRFESNVALQNLSLQIESGLRVAVVGPNGAGKSTLFNSLAGLIQPATGSVRIHGHKPAEYLCLAYVPQDNRLDWSFPVSVEDVVLMGRTGLLGLYRWPSAEDKRRVQACLESVDLSNLAQRQVSQLSGGQRQRMFIARALAQEAEIILLDEPLAGLDMPSQEQILKILDQLKQQGITVLVATHDLEMAAGHFDRILLLNRELIAYGGPEVLSSENLAKAYGGHMQVLETSEGRFLIGDIGGHHSHGIEGRRG